MPAATPQTETTPTTVATNDPPKPLGITGGDPCMGGEATPATTGGPPAGPSGGDGGQGTGGEGGVIGIGHGGGGNPCGGPRRRGHGPVIHLPPNASVDGPLDKAIIRRYIKRNVQKIQFCYERELANQPTLAGTVTAKFVIGPDGFVASSEASGMDGAVATCIAGVIKAIEFPKPKGAKVSVTYPFTFATASDD